MSKIKVSLDNQQFLVKPQKEEIPIINSRIGKSVKELNPSAKDIREFAENVGVGGHTFCPASFKGNAKVGECIFTEVKAFPLQEAKYSKTKQVYVAVVLYHPAKFL